MAYKIATETDAYNIGGKQSGTPTANKMLRYDKVGQFNCQCVNRGQLKNQLVRYADLSKIPDPTPVEHDYWGVLFGDFSTLNSYANNFVITDIVPLCFAQPNEIVLDNNESDQDIDSIYNKYFAQTDPYPTIVEFLEVYGSIKGYQYDGQNLTHLLFSWRKKEQGCPIYSVNLGHAIDEAWDPTAAGYHLFHGTIMQQIRELGFIGWNPVDSYTDHFTDAPSTLQLFELGAGYSYVMTDPNKIRYAVNCAAETEGPYLHWYDAPQYNHFITLFDDDGSSHWAANEYFFYDNVPHLIECGDNIWREGIPDINHIITYGINQGALVPDGTNKYIEAGIVDISPNITGEQISDLFSLQQGHPFSAIPSNPDQKSNLYVPQVFEMFQTVLGRQECLVPRVDTGTSIVIPLNIKEYTTPGSMETPVAYTLCIFKAPSSDPEYLLSNTTDYELLASATTFEWEENAIRLENDDTYALWFSEDGPEMFQTYAIALTKDSWYTAWQYVSEDISNGGLPDMAYSLYITLGATDQTELPDHTGFEYTDPQNEYFPTTFRIDFGPNFKSSIFYTTWKHPFNELRFG